MTPTKQTEWNYLYQERLGILTQGAQPTEAEIQIAKFEADKAISDAMDCHEND